MCCAACHPRHSASHACSAAPLPPPSLKTPSYPLTPPHPLPAEVLGSILGALKSIVAVIGMTRMTPPIKDLLPRLTPILKNRRARCAAAPQLRGAVLPRLGSVAGGAGAGGTAARQAFAALDGTCATCKLTWHASIFLPVPHPQAREGAGELH